MREFSCVMIAFGVLGMFVALGMDTSVSNGLSGRVENIGLLSRQSSGVIASGLLFMTGCILLGLAAVRDAVDRLGPVIVANSPRALAPAPSSASPSNPKGGPDAHSPTQSANRVKHREFGPGFVVRETEPGKLLVRFDGGHQVVGEGEVTFTKSPKVGSILVGSRVRHPSFGEGEIEAVDGDTATVRFDGREKPEPMNMAYLTYIKAATS